MVADAIEKVGQEGAVTVEEAKGTETALEIVAEDGRGNLGGDRSRRC